MNGIRNTIVEIDRLSAAGKEKELEAKKQELAQEDDEVSALESALISKN